jgi:predicted nucleic acid-binding protein
VVLSRLFLIDKSGWEQRRYEDRARQRIGELHEAGLLAICVITLAELLYSSRNSGEMDIDHARLSELRFLPMTPAAEQQAITGMKALAAVGHHRRPIPHLLIAAVAKVHGAVLLHYDHDFELIAGVTGQPHEWIIPRGTGHARSPTPMQVAVEKHGQGMVDPVQKNGS